MSLICHLTSEDIKHHFIINIAPKHARTTECAAPGKKKKKKKSSGLIQTMLVLFVLTKAAWAVT